MVVTVMFLMIPVLVSIGWVTIFDEGQCFIELLGFDYEYMNLHILLLTNPNVLYLLLV